MNSEPADSRNPCSWIPDQVRDDAAGRGGARSALAVSIDAGTSPPWRYRADMSQFDLTDEQRQIQEMAQQFTADAITPHAAEGDEKHIFPRDTLRQAAEPRFE